MQIGPEWKMGHSQQGQNTFCFLHLQVESECISTQPRLRQSQEQDVLHRAGGRGAHLAGSLGLRAFPSQLLSPGIKALSSLRHSAARPLPAFRPGLPPFCNLLLLGPCSLSFGFCSGPLGCACAPPRGLLKLTSSTDFRERVVMQIGSPHGQ